MRNALLLLVLLLCGCGTSDTQVREYLGPEVVRVLENAPVVFTGLIDTDIDDAKSLEGISDTYPLRESGPALSDAQVIEVRSLIFDDDNWEFEIMKGCIFRPGVTFKFFTRDEKQVDLLLCFSCNQWGFVHNGKLLIEDNDRARTRLLKLVHELFPDDEALRKLR